MMVSKNILNILFTNHRDYTKQGPTVILFIKLVLYVYICIMNLFRDKYYIRKYHQAKFHAGCYVRILKHAHGFHTAHNFLTVFCLKLVHKLKTIIYTFLAKGIANTVTKIVSFTYSKDPVF